MTGVVNGSSAILPPVFARDQRQTAAERVRSQQITTALFIIAPMPMPKPDFVLPLNCPKCARELIYVASTVSLPEGQPDTHFYRCPEHGGWIFLPNGRFEPYTFTN